MCEVMKTKSSTTVSPFFAVEAVPDSEVGWSTLRERETRSGHRCIHVYSSSGPEVLVSRCDHVMHANGRAKDTLLDRTLQYFYVINLPKHADSIIHSDSA